MDKSETLNKQSPSGSAASLRILLIVNLPWDTRLGAVRVYSELAACWRSAGHSVTIYSLSEAFPGANPSNAAFAIRQFLFAYKAARLVRRNATQFDVVDAIIGSLSGTKNRLGFSGLLVARSVGLYWLYRRVENEAQRRWPPRPRGKFLGRLLYGLLRVWLDRISSQAVRAADVINVPNKEEADYLREELGVGRPIVIQPYGLAAEARKALGAAAWSPGRRLVAQKVSVVGMWAPRKGSFDWPAIIRQVKLRVPEARFIFLGTMVDEQKVLSELGVEEPDRIEIVPRYSPKDLPALLADCVVGAFPSCIEGFGLGVIEQLAAGIPTVAFDVPGPGGILRTLPQLLVPALDIEKFAQALCEILELDAARYEALSARSVEIASAYDWSRVADETIKAYRQKLGKEGAGGKILFVQPFSVGSSGGGGARILRSLLEGSPLCWESICCSPRRPRFWPNEVHLPTRPSWGKIETSRLARFPNMTMSIFARGFRRRLKSFALKSNAVAIHTVPHSGLDFVHIQAVAHELSLPFFISLHDDIAYTAARELPAEVRESAMGSAWRTADARFVISDALGQEYSRRYGSRAYQVVTDGLKTLPSVSRSQRANGFRIYFMGLFHLAYEQNLRALLEALVLLEREFPGIGAKVTCRCEHIRPHVWQGIKEIDVLPFANEDQIGRDMADADLLYLPMPFGTEHRNFTRFSVSTKMVTYVGSGIPIIYHGPPESAAYEILHREHAAIFLPSLDPREIADVLARSTETVRASVVANALSLAARDFMGADQSRRFWGTIRDSITG